MEIAIIKLWLNNHYEQKQKKTTQSLFNNLLKENNPIFNKDKTFQVQPIVFKNKNLLDDFKTIHNNDSLEKSILFLEPSLQIAFKKHLLSNKLYPLNMFITTPQNFNEYCQVIFPWLEECLNYCKKENLCKEYNLRLPAFLAERFTSFWFSKISTSYFSYARLGKIFLSNKVNSLINPLNFLLPLKCIQLYTNIKIMITIKNKYRLNYIFNLIFKENFKKKLSFNWKNFSLRHEIINKIIEKKF